MSIVAIFTYFTHFHFLLPFHSLLTEATAKVKSSLTNETVLPQKQTNQTSFEYQQLLFFFHLHIPLSSPIHTENTFFIFYSPSHPCNSGTQIRNRKGDIEKKTADVFLLLDFVRKL